MFREFSGLPNLGGKKSLGPLEKPLEIADYVFCPHKKTSRTIRIGGTLIVKTDLSDVE
jgi:hypothetical protein